GEASPDKGEPGEDAAEALDLLEGVDTAAIEGTLEGEHADLEEAVFAQIEGGACWLRVETGTDAAPAAPAGGAAPATPAPMTPPAGGAPTPPPAGGAAPPPAGGATPPPAGGAAPPAPPAP
ncbi:MAG: hypothetical protein AB7U48_14820, partial [Bauldia sp.]